MTKSENLLEQECQHPPSKVQPCTFAHLDPKAMGITAKERKNSRPDFHHEPWGIFDRTLIASTLDPENQQASNCPQGPPCLPLSRGPLGHAISPPNFFPPCSLPHRHIPAEGHTRTTNSALSLPTCTAREAGSAWRHTTVTPFLSKNACGFGRTAYLSSFCVLHHIM